MRILHVIIERVYKNLITLYEIHWNTRITDEWYVIILNGINFIKYLHLEYSEMNEYMNEYIMIEQQNYKNRIISRYCFIATIKVYKCYSPQLPEYLKFFSHVLSYTHTHINHFISNCCAIKWMNGKQIRNMRLLHNSILEYTQINDKWIHCIE